MSDNAHIYVDADACPVKDEVVRVAGRHGLVVTFVANFGLRPSRDPMIRNVVVAQGADAADDSLRALEARHIARLMAELAGNKPEVAKRLGIGLTTLYRKLQEYGLEG